VICGAQNPLSLGVHFLPEGPGRVRAEFRARATLQGYEGILHGGVVAALLDASMTHCLFHHGVEAVTGDLHVRFVRPVACDASLEVRAMLQSARPPLYHVRAELTCGEHLMAWSEAKFVRRRPGRVCKVER
jgi:uncharacterized protein (TIGR00369 family)